MPNGTRKALRLQTLSYTIGCEEIVEKADQGEGVSSNRPASPSSSRRHEATKPTTTPNLPCAKVTPSWGNKGAYLKPARHFPFSLHS
jgi:hypothetical protein